MRLVLWRSVCLALMFGVLAQGPTWAQRRTPADTRELVAVLELDGVNASKSQLAALSEELRAQLLQSGKFRVVDRQQIDTLLKEQAFQQTGCTSQECAVQVGKILGVRKMIVGRVTKIEDELWQLSAQMVDVESAETVRAVTYKHEGEFSTLMDQGMSALAAKLTGTAVAPSTIASAKPPSEPVPPKTLAAGQTKPSPRALPEVARVVDETGTLSPAQQAALAGKLAAFEQRKGSQIAVVLIPTTAPETIEEFSIRLGESWKLGRKGVDDGAFLVVAVRDRRMRIEVGYGLERALPDAVAKRIIADVMAPRFRQGDFYGGIQAGIDRMIAAIDPSRASSPTVEQGH